MNRAVGIGAAATLAHLAVFLAAGISLDAYTDKGDGISYKHMAQAMLGDSTALTDYDSRVFPGYPALIAATHAIFRIPISAAALAVTFVAAGVAAMLATLVFDDIRVGLATAFVLPHAWINCSLAMSEAPGLALILAGWFFARRNRGLVSGIFFGLALLTRPVAIFALLGLCVDRTSIRTRVQSCIASFAIALLGVAFMRSVTGSALHGVSVYVNSPRAYGGRPFGWPFESILWMTLHGNVSPVRWIYITLHVLATLGGCALLASSPSPCTQGEGRGEGSSGGMKAAPHPNPLPEYRERGQSPRNDRAALIWLAGNTLFILCLGLGPGAWGFNHFPRFMILALPPLAWAWRKFLPAKPWLYIPLCVVGFLAGIHGVRATP
jgi:hypothetical protein